MSQSSSTLSLGGSQQSQLMAISEAPSFNYTSHKKDSVAGYTLTQVMENATNTAKHTTFNGTPAYLLAQTTQPTCQGDASGRGGGVKSGTIGKEVKPTSGSSTIFVAGKALVREGDSCTMNNGNVTGIYISTVKFNKMLEEDRLAQEIQPELWVGPTGQGSKDINIYSLEAWKGKSKEEIQARVALLEADYRQMASRARVFGADGAADNIDHFLAGTGTKRVFDSNFIRGFHAVGGTLGIGGAENALKDYFLDRTMQRNWSKYFEYENFNGMDNWDKLVVEYNKLSELSYLSGTSTLSSVVHMDVNKDGDLFNVKGRMDVRWYDPYDWNEGQEFQIPFSGVRHDNNGIFLERYGSAKSFELESNWAIDFEGVYNPTTKKWESTKWTE